tara:strand:- start:173 stop:430 length:258 start_codon:yes stop_codon:yes gene_type:complete
MDEKVLAALTEHLGSREEAEANYDVMVAEQEALDVQFEKDRYKNERVNDYPQIGDQLDDLFRKGIFSDEMATKLQAVKDAHPKPE